MRRIKVIKLGTKCTDIATGLKGTLTHWTYNLGNNITYVFQPDDCNPETGQSVNRVYLEIERLKFKKSNLEEVDVPTEILGKLVKDKASGVDGMVTEFMYNTEGCFHVVIQPKGILKNTRL